MSNLTKTNTDPSEFDGQEPDLEKKLDFFDRASNKNKFWHIRVYGKCIVRHWGRHGSKGQKAVHVAYSSYQAIDEAWKLYYTKEDKGYVKDETTILDRLVREVE